jgi:membrane protein YqaA with SNARE-associated domain
MTGYASLFASALLAATLIPVSSEAVLAALTAARGNDLVSLIIVASVGNTVGAVVNWLLGRYCLHWQNRRWFPVQRDTLERAADHFGRYGLWSLLFAWLPIVGDPLTFVAGMLRVNFWLFVALVGTGKTARYAVIAAFADRVFGSA